MRGPGPDRSRPYKEGSTSRSARSRPSEGGRPGRPFFELMRGGEGRGRRCATASALRGPHELGWTEQPARRCLACRAGAAEDSGDGDLMRVVVATDMLEGDAAADVPARRRRAVSESLRRGRRGRGNARREEGRCVGARAAGQPRARWIPSGRRRRTSWRDAVRSRARALDALQIFSVRARALLEEEGWTKVGGGPRKSDRPH